MFVIQPLKMVFPSHEIVGDNFYSPFEARTDLSLTHPVFSVKSPLPPSTTRIGVAILYLIDICSIDPHN